MAEAVKVLVRCRPMNEREQTLNCGVVVDMDQKISQVQLQKPCRGKERAPQKLFTFDGVYFIKDTTQQIYEEMCFPLVSGVLEGYNGTVFAYGQTGCGKSYSMMGVEDPVENKGVIPRTFEHIFDQVAVTENVKFLVRASYLEIYNEEVRDLLGRDTKKKLDLHEHPEKGVYVEGLSMHKVHDVCDLEKVMELGASNRSMGATLMNVDSSRSHSIFSIEIEMLEIHDSEEKLRVGKLNLVDLAGSERQSKTGSTGKEMRQSEKFSGVKMDLSDRLKEAMKINLSLSALGNVISALVDGKSKHIPYRDSRLTRLLQSSLGGNTKTLMIACISPADNNYDETLSTLRYANRAKNIQNKPRINEDPKDALLKKYQEEIQKLKMMLLGQMDVPADLIGKNILPQQQNLPASQTHQQETVTGVQQQLLTGEQLKNWDEEREALKREYEARIAALLEEFGREQADKTKLQQDLDRLQTEWDAQLAAAHDRFTSDGNTQSSVSSDTTALASHELRPQPNSQTNADVASLSQSFTLGDQPTGSSDQKSARETRDTNKDRQVLDDHAQALKRLEELQNTVIGGEKADDRYLRKNLEERRLVAEERAVHLREAIDPFDDENIIERIFNSLTDEVRVKTHHIEKLSTKLTSAEEDIKDLNSEFENERQDFLDTIRTQDKQLKLYEQLLRTVVPCLRQDCNYYNMDKIKDDCKWSEDQSRWVLPKLVLTKASFSPITSKATLLDKRGNVHSSNVPKQLSNPNVQSSSTGPSFARVGSHQSNTSIGSASVGLHQSNTSMGPSGAGSHQSNTSIGSPGVFDKPDDKPLSHHLQTFGQPDYFKPKRALELLGQTKDSTYPEQSPSINTNVAIVLSNAATVHGIGTKSAGDMAYNRRPGKLQSLPGNPSLPSLNSPRSQPNMDIIDNVEKRLGRKMKSCEPLGDIKPRKPAYQ